MARMSKLTPEKTQEIFNLLAGGNTHDTAAALAGISEATFYNWLKRGREASEKGSHRKADQPYIDFFQNVKKAEALAEAKRIEIIRKASEGNGPFDNPDWKAAAWYLERRYPEKWGRRDRLKAELEHSGEVTERHEYDIKQVIEIDDEAKEAAKQLFRRAAINKNMG